MKFTAKVLIGVAALLLVGQGADAFVPEVAMKDFFFDPAVFVNAQGQNVTWGNVSATTTHSTSSNNGFWSTDAAPGNTATQLFNEAGQFLYHCRFHSQMTGRVVVPLESSAATTTVGVPVTIKWAQSVLVSPFVEDIQLKRPGRRHHYRFWQTGQTATSGNFTPGRAGTYRFRARLRNTTTGRASAFSQVLTISVS